MPIWNEADDAPTGTVTDAGTVMLVELDVSVTVMPEVGAIPDRVTVPFVVVPPAITFGVIETEVNRVG